MKPMLVALMLVVALGASALTEEEAKAYVADHPDLASLDLVDYYALLAATPVARQPESMVVVTDQDVHVTWLSPLVVDVENGRLSYTITLRELNFPKALPRVGVPWWVPPLCIVSGAAGFIGGWYAHKLLN